jgi:hypothetical protein
MEENKEKIDQTSYRSYEALTGKLFRRILQRRR